MFGSAIAKEGKKVVIVSFILFIFFLLIGCSFLTILFLIVLFFSLYIYRLKFINILNLKEGNFYSPISGTITSIDSDGFKNSITIDVSLFDTHNLRSLESGNIKVTHKKGLTLPLGSLKARRLNEVTILEFKSSKLELYNTTYNTLEIPKDKKFQKGEFLGTFLRGEVVVKIDKQIDLAVKIGNRVKSGETLLATQKKS